MNERPLVGGAPSPPARYAGAMYPYSNDFLIFSQLLVLSLKIVCLSSAL